LVALPLTVYNNLHADGGLPAGHADDSRNAERLLSPSDPVLIFWLKRETRPTVTDPNDERGSGFQGFFRPTG